MTRVLDYLLTNVCVSGNGELLKVFKWGQKDWLLQEDSSRETGRVSHQVKTDIQQETRAVLRDHREDKEAGKHTGDISENS